MAVLSFLFLSWLAFFCLPMSGSPNSLLCSQHRLLRTQSVWCKEFLQNRTRLDSSIALQPNSPLIIVLPETSMLSLGLKIFLYVLSGVLSVYSILVVLLKICRQLGWHQALRLGLSGARVQSFFSIHIWHTRDPSMPRPGDMELSAL